MCNERLAVKLSEYIRNNPQILRRLSDPRAARMLRRHYIDGMEWHKVAQEHAYSTENIYVIRRKAAEELRNIIESEELNNGNE